MAASADPVLLARAFAGDDGAFAALVEPGQPAFAAYEPDNQGQRVVSGLQILQLDNLGSQPLITALVSYRDPAFAIRCGLPPALP